MRSPVTSRRRRSAWPLRVRPSASTKPCVSVRKVRLEPLAARRKVARAPSRTLASDGNEPRAEGEAPGERRVRPDDRRIALEAGLAVATDPGDDDLALRAGQQLRPILGVAQLRQLGGQHPLALGPLASSRTYNTAVAVANTTSPRNVAGPMAFWGSRFARDAAKSGMTAAAAFSATRPVESPLSNGPIFP